MKLALLILAVAVVGCGKATEYERGYRDGAHTSDQFWAHQMRRQRTADSLRFAAHRFDFPSSAWAHFDTTMDASTWPDPLVAGFECNDVRIRGHEILGVIVLGGRGATRVDFDRLGPNRLNRVRDIIR